MSIQDHSNGSDSSMLLPGGNPDGQTVTGGGHVPKIRKPYTITKQRERWTEEEHKKFLEALKLYGRAWRKIEDHVGTKNAVQIRSHAQKFFSKVARESKSSNSGSIKPMEIPPPRPKRKPMHPYPRKLVIPVKKDRPLQEQSARSTSPNSSVDQENQSPTSVLSTFASEALQFEDSSTPDGSSSPMSSHDIVNYHGIHIPSCDDPMVQENIYQVDEPISVKLEIFPKSSLEVTSVKVLKLFGQTMFLEDPQKTDPASVCLDQQAVVSAELPAIRYTHTSPQPMEASPSAPVPLRSFRGSMPFPFIQLNSINSTKETLKQNFFSGFTAGSINAASNCHMNQDTGTQIHECSLGSTAIQQISAPAPQSKLGANLKRASSERYTRAFVPYKRSLSEKGTQSSTITNDENNDLQRIRLCF